MLLAGSTRFLSLGVSRSGRREAAAPAHAMAPTRTVCIRQSCLAFRAGVRSSVGFAHGQPRSQGSRRRGRAGGRARAQNTEGRSQRVTTPAHIPSTPTQAAVPPTQAPSFQWPSLVIFQGVQQPRQDARAFPPPASYGGREAPRARPCPASSPLVARLVSSLGQARTRARPGHRARPLLNVWLPTHSFPQRVAARTYSTSPAQAHALVGCTASHRPWHTNERPRAQAVRTSRAKPGAHASASGYRFPAAARKARPRGHAPTQSNTGSVTTPTAQAR